MKRTFFFDKIARIFIGGTSRNSIISDYVSILELTGYFGIDRVWLHGCEIGQRWWYLKNKEDPLLIQNSQYLEIYLEFKIFILFLNLLPKYFLADSILGQVFQIWMSKIILQNFGLRICKIFSTNVNLSSKSSSWHLVKENYWYDITLMTSKSIFLAQTIVDVRTEASKKKLFFYLELHNMRAKIPYDFRNLKIYA